MPCKLMRKIRPDIQEHQLFTDLPIVYDSAGNKMHYWLLFVYTAIIVN